MEKLGRAEGVGKVFQPLKKAELKKEKDSAQNFNNQTLRK